MTSNVFEALACRFLEQQQLTIIAHNFSWSGGEIDIVAKDQQELVFVEVKFRDDDQHGHPLELIRPQQIHRIHQAAHVFLEEQPQFEAFYYRFDAIGITPPHPVIPGNIFPPLKFEGFDIHWIRNAF